jgi:outer membrane immunogenic protein
MKKALLAGIACLIPAWGAAFAADMPVKAPMMAPPVLTWTGFYFGVNAGFDKLVGDESNPPVALTGTDTGTAGIGTPFFLPQAGQYNLHSGRVGPEAGVQAGFDWQLGGAWVFGIEADFDGSGASETQTLARLTSIFTVGTKLEALGTARVRLGWAATPSSMLYLTGGFAYGEHQLSLGAVVPTAVPSFAAAVSTTAWSNGWVVGGGYEGRIWDPHWTIKGEILYVQLRNLSATIPFAYGTNTSTLSATLHEADFVARVGLNYLFF